MKTVLAVAFFLLALAPAKADTLFTLTDSLGTASFTIATGQQPDFSYYDALQYDLPVDINGVTSQAIVYMDGLFHDPSNLSVSGWKWLGVPFVEPYTDPTFTPGTFPSMTSCFGQELPTCQGINGAEMGYATLTISSINTPEPSTAWMLLGALPLAVSLKRRLR